MDEQKKNSSKRLWVVYLIVVVLVGVLVYRATVMPKPDFVDEHGHLHGHGEAVADDNVEYTIEQITKRARGWEPVGKRLYGKKVEDFTVTDIEGNSVSFSSFKGKDVMLVYWATWCPPCRAEIPHLISLRKDIADSELGIIAVSAEDAGVVKDFVADYRKKGKNINYTVGLAGGNFSKMPALLNSVFQYLPTVFYIDKEAKIKLIVVGSHSLTEMKQIIEAKK